MPSVTGETSLVKLLKRFVHNIDVPDGFFYPRITEEQSERALWLDTGTPQHEAIALYERLGWQVVSGYTTARRTK